MPRIPRRQLDAWVESEQGKHICACGCGEVIVIKRHHHTRGIPTYVNGHVSRVANPITGKTGELNPHFRGGRHIWESGYVLILNPDRTCGRDRYVREHRYVMEKFLGRKLRRGEDVHHRNGDKTDNRIENLELISTSDHAVIHIQELRERIGEARFLESRHRMLRGQSYKELLAMRFIADTREKQPYAFPGGEVIVKKLDAGDYSIEGLEGRVALERKSLEDFVNTVIKSRERFFRELDRFKAYRAAAIIVEANLSDIVTGNYPSGASPNSLLGTIAAITVDYGIPVYFCGDRQSARIFAQEWLVRQWKKEQVDRTAGTHTTVPAEVTRG